MNPLISRRDVIKTFSVVTATSLLGNKAWAAKVISEVTANAIDPTVGTARILLSAFPALANDGGSVRLGSSDIISQTAEMVIPKGLLYPIIINRVSATEYVTVDAACTHAGCVVAPFTGNVTTGRMLCPCHGSTYDIHGTPDRGQPATLPLASYPTKISNGVLVISILDQGFSTRQTTILNGSEKRLELSWDSFADVEYEVRHRPNLTTEATPVNFASSSSGPVTGTFILGNDSVQKVWVLPQDGFYQVAIRLRSM